MNDKVVIDARSLPPIPAGDTLYSKEGGEFYSYGPRVTNTDDGQCHSEPPAEGQQPEYYGVYLYGKCGTMPDGTASYGWGWVIDLPSVEAVREYLETV